MYFLLFFLFYFFIVIYAIFATASSTSNTHTYIIKASLFDFLLFEAEHNRLRFIQRETVRKRYITSEVAANLIEILGKHPPATVPASCDFIVELFINKLESTLDLVAPLTTKIVLPKRTAPWRNEEIKKL